MAPGREGVSTAGGRTRDCQGRGSLAELAGWLAGRRAPRGAACLICCFIFILLLLFFEDHLFTPHPASPRSPVTVSPQGESLGV